jgi:DNA-binding MarR family transcriptional regulator
MYKQTMRKAAHPYCRCLFYSANALARASTRVAGEAFAPAGLAPSVAYVLLTVLREPGTSPGHIAEVMMLDRSTVTRLLERLEGKGLVRRRARGRSVQVSPTPAARAQQGTLLGCARAAHERFLELVGRRLTGLTAGVFAAAVAMEGGTD